MPAWEIIVIVAVIASAIVAWMLIRRNQSRHLRARFGPEYDRLISQQGSRDRAEKELARREKRIARLQIRSLEAAERERFVAEWRADQARFVDDPAGAVTGADRLIADVMRSRGYPVADFEQRVDDISVDHADLVENYRHAREIADRHKRGEAGTEDLRQAMVYYRALFEDLLEFEEVKR
jgi:hypothetical protein